MIPPGTNPYDPPQFHKLEWSHFQELCRDIFPQRPGISTCQVYGTPGQSQHGVDLVARREADDRIEVGQCKCHKEFPPADIKNATAEFLTHWKTVWSQKGVRRFILFVACDLRKTNQHEAIDEQVGKFRELGIDYEVRDASNLLLDLDKDEALARRHFPHHPRFLRPPHETVGSLSSAPIAQISELTALAAQFVETQLDDLRRAWREGRTAEVRLEIQALRTPGRWDALADASKAKVLRFEAAFALQAEGSLEAAQRLADEAQALDPTGDHVRLQALLAHHRGETDEALDALLDRADTEGLNLRVAMLLESGRQEEARETLDATPIGPDAETRRLRALLLLMQKNIPGAQREIAAARREEPSWVSVRILSAVVDYCASLSPAVYPAGVLDWPPPVPWCFVASGPEVAPCLRRADQEFKNLVDQADDRSDRDRLLYWRLACLANDRSRQEEAASLCRELLARDPAQAPVLAWALERGFDVDMQVIRDAVRDRIACESADPNLVSALVGLLISTGEPEKALDVAREAKSRFTAAGELDLWILLMTNGLVAAGHFDEAKDLLPPADKSNERLLHSHSLVLLAEAREGGDLTDLISHLREWHRRFGRPSVLFELCDTFCVARRWEEAADIAQRVMREVQTLEATRLGARSLYTAGRMQLCLELIDEASEMMGCQPLPIDLVQMRVAAHQALGHIPEALAAAGQIAREDPSTDNIFEYIRVLVLSGDFRSAVSQARSLQLRDDLAPHQALALATWLWPEAKDLAISFWRSATAGDLTDDLVVHAHMLGFRLGLDSEMEDLSLRMFRFAEQGNASVVGHTLEELRDTLANRQKHLSKIDESYWRGEIPVHLWASSHGVSLAQVYHEAPLENENTPQPRRRLALLAFSGSRSLSSSGEGRISPGDLHLDATAFLMAEHLNLLARLEDSLSPLHVPAELVPALQAMRSELLHHQPTEVDALNRIAELINRGLVRRLTAPPVVSPRGDQVSGEQALIDLEAEASRMEGVLILPESEGKAQVVGGQVCGRGDVLACLRDAGVLDVSSYERACTSMRVPLNQGGNEDRAALTPGMPLVAQLHTLLGFARAGVISEICQDFAVHLPDDDCAMAQSMVEAQERHDRTASWLASLIDRVGAGVQFGRYQFLPPAPELEEYKGSATGPSLDCLRSLLSLSPERSGLVWIDDRFANRRATAGALRMISTLELLVELCKAELLSDKECYEALLRLRAGNVRYIPLTAEEVLFHVRRARIDQGRLVEGPALRVLRRSVAASLLPPNQLRLPTPGGTGTGEFPLVVDVIRACIEAVMSIWKDPEASEQEKLGRSEWLVRSLFFDDTVLNPTFRASEWEQNALGLRSTTVLKTLVCAIDLPMTPDEQHEGQSVRRRFIQWLDGRLIAPWLASDPPLLRETAIGLAAAFRHLLEGKSQDVGLDEWRGYLSLFFRDLPESLQEELYRDNSLMKLLGIRVTDVVTIREMRFEVDALATAVAQVLAGAEGHLTTDMGGPVTLVVEHVADHSPLLTIRSNGEERHLLLNELEILVPSLETREKILRDHPEWVDLPSSERDRVVTEIVVAQDPVHRLTLLRRRMEQSAEHYYRLQLERFVGARRITPEDLQPPDCVSLLAHLRLPTHPDGQLRWEAVWEQAVTSLVSDYGPYEAFARLGGIPAPLPAALASNIGGMSADGLRATLGKISRAAISPLHRAHLVRVLLEMEEGIPAVHRWARKVVHSLLSSSARVEAEVLLELVRHSIKFFASRSEYCAYPLPIQLALAWCHANRCLVNIRAAEFDLPRFRDYLGGADLGQPLCIPGLPCEALCDVSHPDSVTAPWLLLSGLTGVRGAQQFDAIIATRLSSAEWQEEVDDLVTLLCRDHSLGTDALGSFFAKDISSIVQWLGREDLQSQVTGPALRAQAQRALDTLQTDSANAEARAVSQVILGALRPPDAMIDKLRGTARSFKVLSGASSMRADLPFLHFLCCQAKWMDDSCALANLESQLVTLAPQLGTFDDEQERPRLANILGTAALRLAEATLESEEIDQRFAYLLACLMDNSDAVAEAFEGFLYHAVTRTQASVGVHFWPCLLRARAVL